MQVTQQVEPDQTTLGARLRELVVQRGKHPLVAVAIGVAVGFLLARALRR